MNKIRYRINDHARVLLADMLPYETPFIFSNVGFFKWYALYQNSKIPDPARSFLKEIALSPADGFTIPYNYLINRTGGGKLQLSVIHPRSQVRFVVFYSKYDSLVTSQCAKSRYSIRYPKSRHAEVLKAHDPNKRKPRPGDPVDVEAEDFDIEQLYPHTYFVYAGYNLLYKFFESAQFSRYEKRFSCMLSFDLSKCFFSIYTHTIAWAVKSKDFAKANIHASTFEKAFDEAIQCANYKETNGIPVGPEVSRIFAEIILQEIDRSVESRLSEGGFRFNENYAVVRYVDDYYVFAHHSSQAEDVKQAFESELLKYKLFVNEAKTRSFDLPYTGSVAYLKGAGARAINSLIDQLFTCDNELFVPKSVVSPSRLVRKVLKEIKEAALIGDVDISVAASRILFQIRNKLEEKLGQDHELVKRHGNGSDISNVFEVLIEIASYFVCQAYKAQTLVAFSQIILIMRNEIRHYGPSSVENIRTRLLEELNQIFLATPESGMFSVERLNTLLLIKEIDRKFLFYDKRFSAIFYELLREEGGRWQHIFCEGGPGYFSVVVAFYCLEGYEENAFFRESLENIVLRSYRDASRWRTDTQRSMLILDLISCPYLSKTFKKRLLSVAYGAGLSDQKCYEIIAQTSERDWWTQWRERDLQPLLKKMALRPAYEA